MRTIVLALSLSLLLPFAGADETNSACETDQPWIGYRTTDPARAIVAPMIEDAGAFAALCEGEQWDGQDAIEGGSTTASGMGEDPNTASSWDVFAPAGVRATARGASEAYAAFNVAFVGRGAVYAGTCGASDAGLEGEASCGGTRELRSGVYVRDNTPGNLITTFARCLLSVTGCYITETDCSQAVYQQGQYYPPAYCQRDNTAFGVTLILP